MTPRDERVIWIGVLVLGTMAAPVIGWAFAAGMYVWGGVGLLMLSRRARR